MTIEQWFIRAEAYFDGSMTIEEARAFETETAASDELRELMKLWKQTDVEGSVFEQHKAEAEALVKTHQQLKTELSPAYTSEIKRMPTWKWVVAAAIVGGVILGVSIWLGDQGGKKSPVVVQKTSTDSSVKQDDPVATKDNRSQSPSEKIQIDHETLYAQNFSPDEVPQDQSGPLADAYFYYASQQYKKAIGAIDSADSKQATRAGSNEETLTAFYAKYYKALSLMSLGKTDSALPLLEQVVDSDRTDLSARAQWYLALSYLKQNKSEEAINRLQKLISGPVGEYTGKAQSLLANLKK